MAKSENNGDFRYITLSNEDFDDVFQFLGQYYIPTEPISMGIGCTFQQVKVEFGFYVRQQLNTGVSTGTRTNEGKLIGVNLAAIKKKDEVVEKPDDSNTFVRQIYHILDHMNNNYDVFQKQEVNEVLYNAIGCVHPEYQCRGINRKMKENTEQKAIEKGSRVAYSISSGIKSQASLMKIGYVTGYETEYKNFDFLNLTAMGEHKSCKLMVKTLIS